MGRRNLAAAAGAAGPVDVADAADGLPVVDDLTGAGGPNVANNPPVADGSSVDRDLRLRIAGDRTAADDPNAAGDSVRAENGAVHPPD